MSVVRFDEQRAIAAAQALSDTAALLRSVTDARSAAARRALDQWTGPDADKFRSSDLRQLEAEASSIIQKLFTVQASIETAAVRAYSDLMKQAH